MSELPGQPASAPPGARERGTRLDSWKEIAAYVKRDVRTLQRWEKTAGLPGPTARIAFLRGDPADTAALVLASALGGSERTVVELRPYARRRLLLARPPGRGLSVSPDGRQAVTTRYGPAIADLLLLEPPR